MRGLVRWLPALVWMAVIYYFSSRTGDDLDGWLSVFRQWFPALESFDFGHFISYMILGWTLLWAFRPKRLSAAVKLGIVLLCFLYGITDEYHQSFVPRRSVSLTDLRNDAIGAAIGMLLLYIPPLRRLYAKAAYAKYY
ncbi:MULTISPECIES: VanZ family protein [Paenibacillus]|uniref:VanZ family protein n=1 Tax=Paenibacillus TaxID=44249 RepID=UPI0022B8FB00|nr:VanZ family protein [Paenibacillus caseinilyticus]MCZ8520249.1 VanZ family protein [Paenibacillus caseinilyticus]